MLIYHVVLPEVWETFKDENFYQAESLESEGFIHCSYRSQLEDVIKRYYKDVDKILVLIINPSNLTPPLIAEFSTGGEVYPHIYGPINRTAIVDLKERKL
jgi:uncharacterized protein (DUF952 family)